MIEDNIAFSTPRLEVSSAKSIAQLTRAKQIEVLANLLTPETVQALPSDWRTIKTDEQLLNWLNSRLQECQLMSISMTTSQQIVGLLFVHSLSEKQTTTWHIGYLFAQQYWCKGLASELLLTLVEYARQTTAVDCLYAGVEAANTASIKVLVKSGFTLYSQGCCNENLAYVIDVSIDKPSTKQSGN